MFNIFNSNVFIEIGEAIGNLGRRVLKRRTQADELDEAFRRHLQSPISLEIPDRDEALRTPEDIVIEGVFRVIDEEEETK